MDIRQLRHFVAIFENGNMSKAADHIALSQPALTRSIKNLEDDLGVELFERHARGAAPTPAAQRLYHHAKSILADYARARRDTLRPAEEFAGTVSFGLGALFADPTVDRVLGRFCARHPGARVVMQNGYFEDLLRLINEGELEFALLNLPLVKLSDALTFEPLLKVRTSIYVAADNPLATANRFSMQALSNAAWACIDQPHALELLESLFLAANVVGPKPKVRSNSLSTIRSLVTYDGFVGMLPDHIAAGACRAGSVVRLPVPSTPFIRTAGIVARKHAYNRPLAVALVGELRAHFAAQEDLKPTVTATV
ncbi:MAG: LysR family transcriptional regulator [Pseudomonadota bacterium]